MKMRTVMLCSLLLLAETAFARESTDVIVMKNGDRLTGEIKGLNNGVLYISMEYILGTSEVQWSKVDHLESKQLFLVKTQAGAVYSGTLSTAGNPDDRPVKIEVIETPEHSETIERSQIVEMDETSDKFWKRFNGDINLGMIYSKGNQSTQYSLGSQVAYPRERWAAAVDYSSNLSSSTGASASTRNLVEATAMHLLPWNHWFYEGLSIFLQSSEQNIDLQTTLGGGVGRFLKNTNHVKISLLGGLRLAEHTVSGIGGAPRPAKPGGRFNRWKREALRVQQNHPGCFRDLLAGHLAARPGALQSEHLLLHKGLQQPDLEHFPLRQLGQPAAGQLFGEQLRRQFRAGLDVWKPMNQPTPGSLKLPYMRPRGFFDLFRGATSQTLMRACMATAVAWLPLAVLSAVRGGSFLSFLTDYATLSRFLVVIPVLILSEAPLRERRTQVAEHIASFLVPEEQSSKFHAEWKSCEGLRNPWLVRVFLVLLVYATVTWLAQYLSPEGSEFTAWWKGAGGLRFLSPAGTWAAFVSYPILFYLVLAWLWRQLIWLRFLRSTTRLNLKLIAAHPDHLGGLGFLEGALRGQLPFSFCVGVGMAGAVANRVFNDGHPLNAFRHVPLILVAIVLLVCIAPYFLFTGTLMRMRRHGLTAYGAFARAVGEQFEKKWLHQTGSLNAEVLDVPDFSTTTDLYGVVSNINEIRVIPVSRVDVSAVIVSALIPGVPVIIASIPFDTVLRAGMKFMF